MKQTKARIKKRKCFKAYEVGCCQTMHMMAHFDHKAPFVPQLAFMSLFVTQEFQAFDKCVRRCLFGVTYGTKFQY